MIFNRAKYRAGRRRRTIRPALEWLEGRALLTTLNFNATSAGVLRDYAGNGAFTEQVSGASSLSVRTFDFNASPAPRDERSILEFNTYAMAGFDVTAASLQLTCTSTSIPQTTAVRVYGFDGGDGNISLADASRPAVLLGSFVPTSLGTFTMKLDPVAMSSLLRNFPQYLAIRLSGLPEDNVQFAGPATGTTAPVLTLQQSSQQLNATSAGVMRNYTLGSSTFSEQVSGDSQLSVRKFDFNASPSPVDEVSVLHFNTQSFTPQNLSYATLQLTCIGTTIPQTTVVQVYGFADDGTLDLGDAWHVNSVLLGTFMPMSQTTASITLNRAGLSSLLQQGTGSIAIRLNGVSGDNVQFYGPATTSPPRLFIETEPFSQTLVTASAAGSLIDRTGGGTFTQADFGYNLLASSNPSSSQSRIVAEFSTSTLYGPNVTGASLVFSESLVQYDSTPTHLVQIYGFADDGNITLDDATRAGVLLGTFDPRPLASYAVPLDAAGLRSLLAAGTSSIGIRISTPSSSTSVGIYGLAAPAFTPAPQLIVQGTRPVVGVNDVLVNEGDDARFTVTLNQAVTAPVTVSYGIGSTGNGFDATPNVDFIPVSGTLTFAPGETSKVVKVTTIGDAIADSGEIITLSLSNPTPWASLGTATGTATIQDVAHPKPAIKVNSVSLAEGGPGTKYANFTVSLTVASVNKVTVNYATAASTADPNASPATAGVDYQTTTGTLTFNAGQTTATVSVPIFGNNTFESAKIFALNLSSPTNAVLLNASGLGTIVNDDPVPSASIADASVVEGDAGTANAVFAVTLSNPSAIPLHYGWSASGLTATAGADFPANLQGTIDFAAGTTSQTITIPVYGDTFTESDEAFNVTLSSSGLYSVVARSTATGTILDDDQPPGKMSFPARSWGTAEDVDGNGTFDSFTSSNPGSVFRANTNIPQDRSIYEFDVSRLQAGLVSSVTLDLYVISTGSTSAGPSGTVLIGGYAGDGTASLSDAAAAVSPLGSIDFQNHVGRQSITLSRDAVLAIVGSSSSLGIRLDPSSASPFVVDQIGIPTQGPSYTPAITFHADLPIARDDIFTPIAQGTSLNRPAPGLLANDFAPAGKTLTAILDQNPAHGTLTLNGDGSFVYTPSPTYYGNDSFTYHDSDGTHSSNIATVSLTIYSTNQPPVAYDNSYLGTANSALVIPKSGVLGNDSDPNGDAITAVLVGNPAHGSVSLAPDGSFIYTAAANYTGSDSFTYAASDGSMTSGVATVTITVMPAPPPPSPSYSFTTIAAFGSDLAKATTPNSGLVMDAAGNLFGTSYDGGAFGYGTVFEVVKGSNAVTTIASFNGSNGRYPLGSLAIDSQGNLFGTTNSGGVNSEQGTVFEVVRGSNAITTIASFNPYGTDGGNPNGVVLDAQGNLFGTTGYGGVNGAGTVFEVVKGSNAVTTIASFNGSNGRFPIGSLTIDGLGNLFGTTNIGGANGYGTVFEVVRGSNAITTIASFKKADGAYAYGGVVLDAQGNLFGTASIDPGYGFGADSVNHGTGVIFEVVKGSNAITTITTFDPDGTYPTGLVIDGLGNLFGINYTAQTVGVGTVFEVIKGSHDVTPLASFNYLRGASPFDQLLLDAQGNLFGTTFSGGVYGYGTVFKLSPNLQPQPSTVSVVSSSTTVVFGQSVTFTATVSPAGATGMVTFKDGTTTLGTATLDAGGVATLTTSALAVGSHSVTASYGGDSGFNPSVSAKLTETVNKAATTSVATTSASPSPYGQTVTFTATVTANAPGSGRPTGTVTFKDAGVAIGTATLVDGVATLATSTLAVGTHMITTTYSGDGRFFFSTSPTIYETVKATPTVALLSTGSPSVAGQAVTFTATVAPAAAGLPVPTGTVVFKDGATTLATITLVNGVAAFSTSGLGVGGHSVTAAYSGSGSYYAVTSTTVPQAVEKASTTLTLSSTANPSVVGQAITLQATVAVAAPGSGVPGGIVTFYDGQVVLGTISPTGGIAKLTKSLALGNHSITAAYAGDAKYSSSTTSTALNQVVQQAATGTVLTSSVPSPVAGQVVGLTATVSASTPGTGTPAGTVTFKDGSLILGTVSLVSGKATLSVTGLTAGPHSFTAEYSGGSNYAASTSAPIVQSVGKATTRPSLNISGVPALNRPVTITATVARISPASGSPTGSVTLMDGSTPIGSGALVNGRFALTLSTLSSGVHTITAVYGGGPDDLGSTSDPLSVNVLNPATVTASSTANPAVPGSPVTLSATVVSGISTSLVPTGTVTFKDGTTVLGVVPLGEGRASLTLSTLGVGQHSITAVYGGDALFAANTSATLVQRIQFRTTIGLTSSSPNSTFGSPVTLGATVATDPAGGITPTGKVSFYDGSVLLGTVNLIDGLATIQVSTLAKGKHSIKAIYLGDATDQASTSAILTQAVT